MKNFVKIFTIMFLVLVLAISVASFAWFMTNDTIEVSGGDNMNIAVGSNIEVAFHPAAGEEASWHSKLTGSAAKEGITVLDCSGNGKDFYAGEVGQDSQIVPGSMKKLTDLKGAVIEVALDIRTTHSVDVFLGSLSSILPVQMEYDEDKKEGNNNSLFGNFSAGWIAASARVAFFEVTYDENDNIATEDLKFIWMPNAGVELKEVVGDNGSFAYELDRNGTPKTEYIYCSGVDADGNPIPAKYTQNDIVNGPLLLAEGNNLCTADNVAVPSNVNQSRKLLSFESDGTMQVKHLMIRIWFEGYDNECTEVMLGGKVNYNFSFAGILAKDELTADQKADFSVGEGKIQAVADGEVYKVSVPESLATDTVKLLYSYDGITFAPFFAETHPGFAPGTTVYFQIMETPTTYASEIISLDIPA